MRVVTGVSPAMTVVVTSTVVHTTSVTVSHTTSMSRLTGAAEEVAAKRAPARARVLEIGAIVGC